MAKHDHERKDLGHQLETWSGGGKDVHIVDKIPKNKLDHRFVKPMQGGNTKYETLLRLFSWEGKQAIKQM